MRRNSMSTGAMRGTAVTTLSEAASGALEPTKPHRTSMSNQESTENAIKAYSYVRFSTPEQKLGHSMKRQIDDTRVWAQRRGIELDEGLFIDEGVSAFHGLNATEGKLAAFREAVKDGTVPRGSYLVVESLDRISRQKVRRAARVIEDIVDLGITVWT
jgi:DNA invertase Pin-like site-specific DNA recombinase